jgi:hypothetical protein
MIHSVLNKIPKVSVIIPNYNHAPYLKQRIDSVLTQTFQDIEVIILDDASTDNSHEVIQGYLADSRVSFHPNKTNSGSPFIQWNRGVQLARGEYVWIAESDDYCTNDFLATMVPLLDMHNNVGLAYCQSWRVDSDGNREGNMEWWTAELDTRRWNASFINQGHRECADYLLWKNTIPNASAVLLRKKSYWQAGGAQLDMRLSGDWLTWVRMLMVSDVAFSSQCLNHFRFHASSVRETTELPKSHEELWRVRHFISSNCRLSRPIRRTLASQAVNEWLIRFRTALPSERKQKAFRAFVSLLPFFIVAPATAIKTFIRRRQAK